MPVILVAGGGALMGWGITNEWDYVAWAGIGMIAGGIIWGLILWLWVDAGTW
jgi:hypothetical protein